MFSRSPFLCGDSLSLMECMDNDCYHAVVTDPPYASGGLTTAERKASPARKYLSSSRYLSFDNDTRDQSTHFFVVRHVDAGGNKDHPARRLADGLFPTGGSFL